MAKSVVRLAKKVSALDAAEYAHFKEWVSYLRMIVSSEKKSPTKKVKRAYKKRAPKAVEVAPGVRVTKRGKRSASSEIDHSPRPISEQ